MVFKVKIYVSFLDEFDDIFHYIETKKYSSEEDMRYAMFGIVDDYHKQHYGKPFSCTIDNKEILLFLKEF